MLKTNDANPKDDAVPVAEVVEPSPAEKPPKKKQAAYRATVQALLIIGFLGIGAAVTFLLVLQKTAPATTGDLGGPPVVEVLTVSVGEVPVTIDGFGEVRTRQRVQLVPQVGGRILEKDDGLIEGGTVEGGEVLLRIDPADAELAVRQAEAELARLAATLRRLASQEAAAEAAVAQAETRLETERAEADVARQQYERLNPDQDVPPLVARLPQVREAEAALRSAEANAQDVELQAEELAAQKQAAEVRLDQAQLSAERTEVRLPKGGSYRVTRTAADVGQFVAPGQTVAELYRVGAVEVPLPLPARDLALLDLPGTAVTLIDPATRQTWTGTAVRTDGEIDPQSRLVRVIVLPDGDTTGLVPGMFVRGELIGRPLSNVAAVPRLALRSLESADNNRRTGGLESAGTEELLYVVRDGLLRFVPVTIVHREAETAYVEGLNDGDQIVLTDLDIVTDKMEVSVGEV
jgi:RND family efflux transporter MFP subunit